MKMLNPKCLAVFLNGGFLIEILLKLMIWEYPISRNTQISANENHFYYLALIYYHSYLLQYYTETIYIYIYIYISSSGTRKKDMDSENSFNTSGFLCWSIAQTYAKIIRMLCFRTWLFYRSTWFSLLIHLCFHSFWMVSPWNFPWFAMAMASERYVPREWMLVEVRDENTIGWIFWTRR